MACHLSSTEFDIYLIDSDSDGLAQISEHLNAYQELSSVHIVSHGSDGQVKLGNTILSSASIDGYASDLVGWRDHLAENADILFYGCNLSETEEGRQLVEGIAELSGADVAASDDLTGHEDLGGDWILEFRAVGRLRSNTDVAFSAMPFSRVGTTHLATITSHHWWLTDENDGDTVVQHQRRTQLANSSGGTWVFRTFMETAISAVGSNNTLDFTGDAVIRHRSADGFG